MKKRCVLLLMTAMLITLGGCAKGSDAEQTSGDDSVSGEQSASEEDKGGMSSSDSDDMETSAQKAYDLWASFRGILYGENEIGSRYYKEHENEDSWIQAKKCKYNYEALTEDEQKTFDELYPDVKSYYTFYECGPESESNDVYTEEVFKLGGISDDIKSLSEDTYCSATLDSYRIEDGKIYAQNDTTDYENGTLYKFEGELAINEIPYYCEQEWLENHQENYQASFDSIIEESGVENVDLDKAIEDYSAYLDEWKTASWVGNGDSRVIVYRIKDYEDGTLIIDDCYREAPSFIEYLWDKYPQG